MGSPAHAPERPSSPSMLNLHSGQVCCCSSQGSTQSRWNSCWQGSTRSHCRERLSQGSTRSHCGERPSQGPAACPLRREACACPLPTHCGERPVPARARVPHPPAWGGSRPGTRHRCRHPVPGAPGQPCPAASAGSAGTPACVPHGAGAAPPAGRSTVSTAGRAGGPGLGQQAAGSGAGAPTWPPGSRRLGRAAWRCAWTTRPAPSSKATSRMAFHSCCRGFWEKLGVSRSPQGVPSCLRGRASLSQPGLSHTAAGATS